ncbi:MAG: N-6 DNA methylase [Bacteroidales bacterium]|nr:N-6 DNA methylase [Bacteroidales bacterium]
MINKYSIDELERHFIYYYLENKGIDFNVSELLKDYFNKFIINHSLYLEISSLEIQTIKDLENILELLIPETDRKFNGAFFTPTYIVESIINEVKPLETDKCIDLSSGCGAFHIGLVDYYKKNFNKNIKNIIKENIYGVDILEYNIKRAKILLTILGLQNNEIISLEDFNIVNEDSLKCDLNKIFFRNNQGLFNVIVGNPPYVKFQDLSDENRKYLLKHFKSINNGTFNLYFAFFELGYKLLTDDGRLGYITPNNYFTSLSGESLRSYFQSKKCVIKIIDFSHKKVFDAQTYTALTFLNNKKNQEILFDRINGQDNPEIFLKKIVPSINKIDELNSHKWRLLKTNEQVNIKKIETSGIPINKLFDICVGIATLKDGLYFIDGTTLNNNYYLKNINNITYKIEAGVTKPVYKISDFKTQQECNQNTRRIIFPYKIEKGIAVPYSEDELFIKYPECFYYFNSYRQQLKQRDKGKNIFSPFFAYGRTQGLAKIGKKLLTPTFSQYPRFLIVEDKESFFTNGYGFYFRHIEGRNLFASDEIPLIAHEENISIVQKILNSIVMHYYISKTSVAIEGNYPCYQKNFIEKFSIPLLTKADINILNKINNKEEIDMFLIKKYQLNIPLPNLSV